MKALLCDIDGTLADIRHRLHHVLPGGKRDWDAFFAEMGSDDCVEPVREILRHLPHEIVLCSGRPEGYRETTTVWLRSHGVPYDRLYMRPDGDTRADHVVKAEILAQIIADGYEPFAVIDDRASVVAMWREKGLFCFQVAPSEVEIPRTAVLTLMVGPSGGGKSTWLQGPDAVALGIRASQVIASDDVRHDLCGDFRDQTKNTEVFAAVHALARARLAHGLPAVIDATHLRRRDRVTAAALVPLTNEVRYVIIDRPMEAKRRDGGWRNALPIDLLAKHDQTFRSQIAEILRGDDLPNVTVYDRREAA